MNFNDIKFEQRGNCIFVVTDVPKYDSFNDIKICIDEKLKTIVNTTNYYYEGCWQSIRNHMVYTWVIIFKDTDDATMFKMMI